MSARGHNERSYRLDALASDVVAGFSRVDQGEENVIGGWLAIGHAMNEARSLFPGDREFGQWVQENVLGQVAQQQIEPKDQQAAMWAAANADQFEEARQRGNPRTIRGIHAKWKEIEAEREAERFAEEQRQRAEEQKKTAMERADEAKRIAEEKAAAEREAQEAVKTATDPAERKKAEDVAEKATADRKEAEKQADASIDEIFAEREAAPDPYGYGKLTEDALLDLANGLRADLDEEKAKRKAADAEAKSLKAQLRDFQGDDKDEVIRRLQASVKNAENAKWKALEGRDAYHRQLHAVKKERDAAIKKYQDQEVTI